MPSYSHTSAKERRALIMKMLEKENEVSVTALSKSLGISEVTIRKDLTLLQSRKLLVRTRGGAIRRPIENLSEDTAIGKKRMFNFREKERIGQLAASLIKNGDHIMFDSGTTTMEIAKNLDRFTDLTILTNSVHIAEELLRYKRFTVIVLGGHLRINSHSTIGPLALQMLSHFTNYKLFLGVDSFSFDKGISTPSMEEAMLNQAMISQANEVIAVFDSSKFNKRSFCHIANAEQIHAIVTDKGLPAGSATKLREKNIKLYLA
jgi:DeoR/GlpR family transcriptional regulator of sugar metabolism